MSSSVAPQLSPSQRALSDLWDEHLRHEFATKDTDRTLETMVEDAYVNHVPVLTGGTGHAQLREFYSKHFISQMPPDLEIIPISRTIAEDRLVDEMVARFTHSVRMDWALPGIAPTGRRGLLHTDGLPLVGVESGNKVLDPTLPSNTLIARLSK